MKWRIVVANIKLKDILTEKYEIDLDVGDTILRGKFKNKSVVVKDFGIDDKGQPTINGKKMLSFRIKKLMPKYKDAKITESKRDPASIKKEYKDLKKQSIGYLRQEWSRLFRVGNPKGTDKEGLVSDIIRAYHGDKYVNKAFNIKEAGFKNLSPFEHKLRLALKGEEKQKDFPIKVLHIIQLVKVLGRGKLKSSEEKIYKQLLKKHKLKEGKLNEGLLTERNLHGDIANFRQSFSILQYHDPLLYAMIDKKFKIQKIEKFANEIAMWISKNYDKKTNGQVWKLATKMGLKKAVEKEMQSRHPAGIREGKLTEANGDVYFSKREGNAIGVMNNDKLHILSTFKGTVSLGKVMKSDKRWKNMGKPSEKLLIGLAMTNLGGLNTKETQTTKGKLIYKFIKSNIREGKLNELDADKSKKYVKKGTDEFHDALFAFEHSYPLKLIARKDKKLKNMFNALVKDFSIIKNYLKQANISEGKLNEFEGKPIPMDTPNEFAYLEFKKFAYKKRGQYKKDMLKHKGDSSKMFKTASAWWFKWAYKNNKAYTHIKDSLKFGRALMVMMVKDDLIFSKKAWKKNNKITNLK